MDWTALVDGPLPNVFLRHVPALVVLEDAPSDAPLQSDVLTVENVVVQADEPSDADVLTVGGEAPYGDGRWRRVCRFGVFQLQ